MAFASTMTILLQEKSSGFGTRFIMPICSIQLTDEDLQFLEEQVSSGFYRNTSEAVGAGLRLLERKIQSDHDKLSTLRSLAEEAFADLDAGRGIPLHNEAEVADLIRRIGQAASTVPSSRRDA